MTTVPSNFSIFLQQVQNLHETQKKLSDLNGENFNIFSILGMEGQEVKTHSAFLRELLDPNGAHAMGDHFLKAFLQIPQIEGKLSATSSKVVAERYIGRIDNEYSEGGFIDLLIEDKDEKRIIIENKIYAGDQKNQLLRYQRFDPSAELIYLTLDGHDASLHSLGGEEIECKSISYATEILEWLKECRKEAVEKPVVREALSQYIELIRRLTNQTTKDAMKEEIQELLSKNPEFVSSAKATIETWNSMAEEFFKQVRKGLGAKLKANGPIMHPNSGIRIECEAVIDRDGFWIGYKLYENDSLSKGSELGKYVLNELKKRDAKFYGNGCPLFWFNPEPFEPKQKSCHLPSDKLSVQKIVGILNWKEEQEKFIDELFKQHETARNLMFEIIQER